MEGSVNIHQKNSHGNNSITIEYAQDIFRPYEKVLSVGVEKKFLDDASENLIRDGKLHRNEKYINQVKQYLDDRKFCLIEAPEGRGKTYLSRIIAYDYHHTMGKEVYFLDLKDNRGLTVNSIDDKLQEWHNNSDKEYLIVIENVHVYQDLELLRNLINGWINSNGNSFWFLLNSRPTDVEDDEFSDWEEIVKLSPNKEDVNGIINLFYEEVGRDPFVKDKHRDRFVETICPNKKEEGGANLRLLKIYLETWQNHNEIRYMSDVSEKTVIDEFRLFYKLKRRSNGELEALWYISSLYQFDVPMHENFVQNVGNLVKDGLLRYEKNRYFLPHSVDATFLFQAICDYKHKNYDVQMQIFADCFVKKILDNDCPRDFESDFRLLTLGLSARKDVFMEAYYHLTSENNAKDIITKINPGYVIHFFHPENHEKPNPDTLLNYYLNNKGWLKPLFKELSHHSLIFAYRIFMKYLRYNFLKDIFEGTRELDDYLRTNQNYRALIDHHFIQSIIQLGDDYKTLLIDHYENNKDLLKTLLLEHSPTSLVFVRQISKNHLNINIVKDVFGDPSNLDNYLRANPNHYKIFVCGALLFNIIKLSTIHKTILIDHYKNNKALLKSIFLGCSPIKLSIAYQHIKNYLYINIVKDVFEETKDLENYLRSKHYYNQIIKSDFLIPLANLSDGHKTLLIEYYENNKDLLKLSLLASTPSKLVTVYKVFNDHLGTNLVKDLFEDTKDLDTYLRDNHNHKIFTRNQLLIPIIQLGTGHKTLLIEYYENNKALLKPLFLRSSLSRLYYIYKAFNDYLGINLVKDLFEDIKDLDTYLWTKHSYKLFIYHQLLIDIIQLSDDHKTLLITRFEKNKTLLKSWLLRQSPTVLIFFYKTFKKHLGINIIKDIFNDLDDLEKYLKNNDGGKEFQLDDVFRDVSELGDKHKQLLNKYNVFDFFFDTPESTKNSFRICPQFINEYWSKKCTFDVSDIKANSFYLDGVSWAYLEKFVSLINQNITEENRLQSISIVKALNKVVLAKENALCYASAKDLSFFFYNIASVNEAIFRELAENDIVQKDIERRLEASSYSILDLYLFDHFFNQSWCKAILEPKILNADKAQKMIIKKWHDEFLKKLVDRGREITSGSLLDYIHHNLELANSLSEDEVKQ